jgi:hypothetical protein
MNRSNAWLAPITGVAFIVVAIIAFVVAGEPKSADDPVAEIVEYYVDNKDSVQIGAVLGVVAGVLLVFFGAHLRTVLRAATGGDEMLSLVSFVGLVIVALGIAIDGTISFALAEAAKDVHPVAVQSLQTLWDNDFLPIMLGVILFLLATGISVVRSGVLPRWLGWLMIALAIIGPTPIGFASAIGAALLVLVLSVILTIRARAATQPMA